ncbi:MAG: SDR family oxidoreductase [Betaproteobacteria bacterium]|nr:SDR family oxidoreductase [Betaproteobacteria bacterium]
MDLKLKDRSALITGASKGIGFAVAEALAAEGCHLHLVARTHADLESARDRIAARYGVKTEIHAMDLAERGQPKALAAKCPEIDVLVNNAGSIPRGTVEEIDEERWRAAWDLKVFGYINLTREYFRLMKARLSGVIVNIIGNGGERLDAAYIAGGAGNAALMAFTRALGGSSAEVGVRVIGVNPGPVATERLVRLMRTAAQSKFGDAERWRELEKSFPFGRAATVEEIASTVALLASDLSSYTTGTIVTIDGGMTNRGSLI